MALTDAAVAIIGTGVFYTATVATAAPANYLAPGVGWTHMGHTSIENILALQSEGGDVTTLGTLQAEVFRSTTTPRVDSFAIISNQWDLEVLKMYFGSNATQDATTKLLAVPSAPVATEKAFLAVFTAGAYNFAIHAAKVEIKRGDDLDISERNTIAGVPLLITPVSNAGSTSYWGITPLLPTGTAPFGA